MREILIVIAWVIGIFALCAAAIIGCIWYSLTRPDALKGISFKGAFTAWRATWKKR